MAGSSMGCATCLPGLVPSHHSQRPWMQSQRATTCMALRSRGISTSTSISWTMVTLVGHKIGALGVRGRPPGALLHLLLLDRGGLQQMPGAANGHRTGAASSGGARTGGVEEMALLCGPLGSLDLGVCRQCTVLHCGRWSRARTRGQGVAIPGLAAMAARATARQVQSHAHGGELRHQQALQDRHGHHPQRIRLLGLQRLVSSCSRWVNSVATLWQTM
mmetsp:Transcript_4862/g.9514  ORF Transcript_4862/g.9514 Transcript_4862/m.9514 type:complete len:218 (+) Transcript_4862:2-655(+)